MLMRIPFLGVIRLRLPAFACVWLPLLIGETAIAQSPVAERPATVTSVRGTVHDSLAQKPLAMAIVQLASIDDAARPNRTAQADTRGQFTIDNVPAGRYALGFFHPLLDSLGIEPPVREVIVAGAPTTLADIAIPSAESFRTSICGRNPPTGGQTDGGALVFGIVRSARDGTAASNVAVVVEWLEFSFSMHRVARQVPVRVARTAPNGWFAVCDVPGSGAFTLSAGNGADSTEKLELQMPTQRLLRRDLYLDGATSGTDRLPGRLSGIVVTGENAKPVAGAEVSLPGSLTVITRANERGEWTLADAPAGTHMLEVRAVGYYPDRRAVDIVPDAPPVRVLLATLKSVLATVRVTAPRTLMSNMKEFDFRRKTAIGQFITAADLERRQPVVASDVFRFIPGISVVTPPDTAVTRVQLRRGAFHEPCYPDTYLDGRLLGVLSVGELDALVIPKEIRGIEIYVGANVPAQFSSGTLGNACGSILIWTKFG